MHRAWATVILMMASAATGPACAPVPLPNYSPPPGTPTATLTFAPPAMVLQAYEQVTVSVIVDDLCDIDGVSRPAINFIHSSSIEGSPAQRIEVGNRTQRIEAGKPFIFHYIYSRTGVLDAYCDLVAEFNPEPDGSYEMEYIEKDDKCGVRVQMLIGDQKIDKVVAPHPDRDCREYKLSRSEQARIKRERIKARREGIENAEESQEKRGP